MIRKLELEDLGRVLEITRSSFSRPWPKREFTKHQAETLVAVKDKEITGFIVGKTTDNKALIKLIAIAKDYRQQGIGRDLIESLLGHFKKNSVKTVSAHARISNLAGTSFLKSSGLEIVKTVENYYSDNEDAYLLKKELN